MRPTLYRPRQPCEAVRIRPERVEFDRSKPAPARDDLVGDPLDGRRVGETLDTDGERLGHALSQRVAGRDADLRRPKPVGRRGTHNQVPLAGEIHQEPGVGRSAP